MKSLKALERQIEADRAAIGLNYRRLHQAVNHKVGSPAGLIGGFAAGFAGGWLVVSRSKRRRERAETCPEPASTEKTKGRTKQSTLSWLYRFMILSMPLWQKMLTPSGSAATAAPDAGDSA